VGGRHHHLVLIAENLCHRCGSATKGLNTFRVWRVWSLKGLMFKEFRDSRSFVFYIDFLCLCLPVLCFLQSGVLFGSRDFHIANKISKRTIQTSKRTQYFWAFSWWWRKRFCVSFPDDKKFRYLLSVFLFFLLSFVLALGSLFFPISSFPVVSESS